MSGDFQHERLLPQRHLFAIAEGDVDAGNAVRIIAVPDDDTAGRALELQIAANVIVVMVGVENVGEAPAETFESGKNRFGDGRIDRGAAPLPTSRAR